MIISNRIYIAVFAASILRSLLIEALPDGYQGDTKEYHRGYQGRGEQVISRPYLQNGPKSVEESDASQIEQVSQQTKEFQQQEGPEIHPDARHQVVQQHQVQEESQVQDFQKQQESQQITKLQRSQNHQEGRYRNIQKQQESQTQQGPQYQILQLYQGPQAQEKTRNQEMKEQQESQAHQLQRQQQLPVKQDREYQQFQRIHPGARNQKFQGHHNSQQEDYPEFHAQQVSQNHLGARYQDLQHRPQVYSSTLYQRIQPHQALHVPLAGQYHGNHDRPGHLAPQYQEYQSHPQGPQRSYYHDGKRYYPQHHEWQRGYNLYKESGYPIVYSSSPEFPYPPEHPDYQAALTAYSHHQPHFYKSDGSKVKFTYIPLENSRDSKIIIPGPNDRSNIKYVRISQDGDEKPKEKLVKQVKETNTPESEIIEESPVRQQKNYQKQGQIVSTANAFVTASTPGLDVANVTTMSSIVPDSNQDSNRENHKRKKVDTHPHRHEVASSEDKTEEYDNTLRNNHYKHFNKNMHQQSDLLLSNSEEQTITVVNQQSEATKTNKSNTSQTVTEETVVEISTTPQTKYSSHTQQTNEKTDTISDLRSQDTQVKVDSDREYNEAANATESDESSTNIADTEEIAVETSNETKEDLRSFKKQTDEGLETNSDLKVQTTEFEAHSDTGNGQDESKQIVDYSETQTTDVPANQQYDEKQSDPWTEHESFEKQIEQSQNDSNLRSQVEQETTLTESLDETKELSGRRREHDTFAHQLKSETNPNLGSQDTEAVPTNLDQQNTEDEAEYGVTKGYKLISTESSNQSSEEQLKSNNQQSESEQFEFNSDLKSQGSKTFAYSGQEQNQNEFGSRTNEGSVSEDDTENSDSGKESTDSNTDEAQPEQHSNEDDYIIAENESENTQDNDYLENTLNHNDGIVAETAAADNYNKEYTDSNDFQAIKSYTPYEKDENSQSIDAQSKNTEYNEYSPLSVESKDTKGQENEQLSQDEESDSTFDVFNIIENYAAAYNIAKVISSSALEGIKKVFEDPAVKVYIQPIVQQFLPYYLHLKNILENLH